MNTLSNPSSKKHPTRWALIILTALVALLVAGFFAFQFAIQTLKKNVEKALGPNGEVKEIRVGLTGIEITNLRIRASQRAEKGSNWPVEDELRAERILVSPSISDLISARVVLDTIRIEGAYISMLRATDGRIKVLPSLLQPAAPSTGSGDSAAGKATSAPPVSISKIELISGTIEFFDATIRQPLVKQRLEQINASIKKLQIPALTGQSSIQLEAIHKGVGRDGKISISGSIELATKESGITTILHGVDMVSLQPYLIKATETGVKQGSLDFELNSTVKKGILHAPGSLTLNDLELSSSSGTIMGMPRKAAVMMMKNKKGKITVNFVLSGNINDPNFSLNENLATRIGASIADKLGVNIGGLAKGVESLGSGMVTGIGKSLGILKNK